MAEITLSEMVRKVEDDAAKEHKKAKVRIGILALLTVFVCAYMTWIYVSVAKLDAGALTEVGRDWLVREMPNFRSGIADQMKDQAPAMVEHGIVYLKKAPPVVSQRVEIMVLRKTQGVLLDLEDQLDAEMGQDLEEHLAELERQNPDMTPQARIEAVLEEVRDGYRTKMEGLVDEMYIQYADELGAVDEVLTRLRTAKDLTPRERIQKDIIEATVALRAHYVEPEYPDTQGFGAGGE